MHLFLPMVQDLDAGIGIQIPKRKKNMLDILTSSYRIILISHSSPLIQPSLARSKWNTDEIWGLKFHFRAVARSENPGGGPCGNGWG